MARPIKLSLEIQESICQAIRAGNYIETAAAFAGIDKTTLYDWLKRGARAKGSADAVFVGFSHSVQKALSDSEVTDVATIGVAAKENWQAAAWRLERKFPERWGRKDSVKHSGDTEAPIKVIVEYAKPDRD
jgi:transposase